MFEVFHPNVCITSSWKREETSWIRNVKKLGNIKANGQLSTAIRNRDPWVPLSGKRWEALLAIRLLFWKTQIKHSIDPAMEKAHGHHI